MQPVGLEAHRVSARGSLAFVGEHRRNGLGHAIELTGPATEPIGDRVVLIVGDVLGKPAVPKLNPLDGLAAGENHSERCGEEAGASRLVWRAAWGKEAAGRERVHESDRSTGPNRRRKRVVLRVGMEQGQHDDVSIVVGQRCCFGHDLAGERIVGLGYFDTLGPPGRTTGEHDRGQVANVAAPASRRIRGRAARRS